MKTIAIIVFDQFTDIDVFLPWDLFNRIRLRDKSWNVKFLGTQSVHKSITGVELKMHGWVEQAAEADVVLFTSGPGTRQLYRDYAYLNRFQLNPDRQVIASMCSGALILAGLGLLDGISATTYPTAFDILADMGITVERDSHLVTHGNLGTAAGCMAAIDLVSWCLDRVTDIETREAVIASVQPIGQGQVCIY